jgi:hypothetical protein
MNSQNIILVALLFILLAVFVFVFLITHVIATAALAFVGVALPVFIVFTRIKTKAQRERLRMQWNAEPKIYVPPSMERKPEPVIDALTTDPTHCPFCRGDIERGVLKCKHCGEWLSPDKRKEQETVKAAQLETAKSSKSTNQVVVWIFVILFGIPALIAIFRGC